MSTWNMQFIYKMAPWLRNPRQRWNQGLEAAGVAYMGAMQKYPGRRSGSYKRTGTLGNKAKYTITRQGEQMNFEAVTYAKHAIYGTGIYGRENRPIRPVKAKFLAWQAQGQGMLKVASGVSMRGGKMKANKGKDVFMIFAREVKGYIWAGFLEKLVDAIKKGYRSGIMRPPKG